ncbi:transcriptional regulator [Mesorhizobium kowhaii]|uniref:Transcriptional regulator n=2 Tax=Mesorhizobium kowhaii TaxID=1300272 RepID=A0A2W7CAS3_9HYPH|nr:transcriptional regulator [Mesorhizobium kowhaii]
MIDVRFSTAVQMVLSIALAEHDGFRCTSQTLADGLGANPSFVRTLMVPLNRDGLLLSTKGKGGGIRLGRPSDKITLRDIYCAVTEDKKLFVARPDVPARCRISANIGDFFQIITQDAEGAVLHSLENRTVADSLKKILQIDRRRQAKLSSGAPAKLIRTAT